MKGWESSQRRNPYGFPNVWITRVKNFIGHELLKDTIVLKGSTI